MPECAIHDCDKPSRTRGWCQTHYKRWCRHGDPLIAFADRNCSYCGDVYTPTGGKQKACPACSALVPLDYSRMYEAERRGDRSEYKTAYNRDYRARNRDELRIRNAKWARENREYVNAKRAEWRERNREAIRDYHRKHYRVWGSANRDRLNEASHRRRARLRNNGVFVVTPQDITRLRRAQGDGCAYCGVLGDLTLDHVVPIARGGAHSIGNLVLACGSCNRSKGARTLTEWRVWRKRMGMNDLQSLTVL